MSEFDAKSILNKSAKYKEKSPQNQILLAEALEIVSDLGIPIQETRSNRTLEKMAMVFLALTNVRNPDDWKNIVKLSEKHYLKTRAIIDYINRNFQENISSGSYDDIRREDLKFLVPAQIILPTEPETARNNPNRAYRLNPVFAELIQHYQTELWEQKLKEFLAVYSSFVEELSVKRQMQYIPVKISSEAEIRLTLGEHNALQKAIIEEFLSRYGFGAELLYLGDAADKYLLLDEKRLQELNFFKIGHGELPDVIAYSASKNWLYLIEAVHSSGAIDALRLRLLKELTQNCTAEII